MSLDLDTMINLGGTGRVDSLTDQVIGKLCNLRIALRKKFLGRGELSCELSHLVFLGYG